MKKNKIKKDLSNYIDLNSFFFRILSILTHTRGEGRIF